MERRGWLALVSLCALAACVEDLRAQYVVSAHAGTINYVSGQVSVEGQPIHPGPTQFPLLKNGQTLSTARGRAEVLLGPGVFVRLGDRAALRMVDNRLEDTQVELQHGVALVEVIEITPGSDVHLIVGPTRTGFRGIGLHRFETDSARLDVFGGHAEVSANGLMIDASRGRAIHLDNSLAPGHFDPRRKDALLQWAAGRSFGLFISNPAARARQTNWEIMTADSGRIVFDNQSRAYYRNRDFGVTFNGHGGIQPLGRETPPPFISLLPKSDPGAPLPKGNISAIAPGLATPPH